ncbi:hypothetical protein BGZ94_000221, partial [Podila epigama]
VSLSFVVTMVAMMAMSVNAQSDDPIPTTKVHTPLPGPGSPSLNEAAIARAKCIRTCLLKQKPQVTECKDDTKAVECNKLLFARFYLLCHAKCPHTA